MHSLGWFALICLAYAITVAGVSIRVAYATPEGSRITLGLPLVLLLVFFASMNLIIQHRAFSYKNATWMTCFALTVHVGYALMACYLLIGKEDLLNSPGLIALPLGIFALGVIVIVGFFIKPTLRRCIYVLISTNQTDLVKTLPGENQYYVRVLYRTLIADGTYIGIFGLMIDEDVLEYRGTMAPDASGKLVPHGRGEWMDSSFYGEYLQGQWQKSRPHPPFISISTTEGNIYYKFWIPFATTHSFDDTLSLTRVELKYGLAMVTACVSGWFYKKYPKSRVVHLGDSLAAVFPHYQPLPYDTEPSRTRTSRAIPPRVSREAMSPGGDASYEDGDEEAGLANYIQQEHSVRQTKIAVVFIHGFNHSFVDGLLEFAQLSALAHWPPHVTPFYFSWPGGSRTDYLNAVPIATSEAFFTDAISANFLLAIRAQGYTEFHLLAHSMGARVVHGFVLNGHISKVFDAPFQFARTSTYELIDAPPKARVILAAPDLELAAVRKIYPMIIPYCRHITLYADPRDIAVGFSAVFLHCNDPSIGAWGHSLIDMRHVDVIDCYHLEHNTGANYHGYFFMNLSIVGDIRDIVVHKLKARHRSDHLVPKRFNENSYQFKVVPSGFSTVK